MDSELGNPGAGCGDCWQTTGVQHSSPSAVLDRNGQVRHKQQPDHTYWTRHVRRHD